MKVYALTKTALTPLNIPVYLISCTLAIKPIEYITYSLIDAPNKTNGDGKVTGISARIQVDFMTKTMANIEPKGSQIEDLMLNARFMRVGNPRDNYDMSTGYYYRQQDFRYYERR